MKPGSALRASRRSCVRAPRWAPPTTSRRGCTIPKSVEAYEKQRAELGDNPSDDAAAEHPADPRSAADPAARLPDQLHPQIDVRASAGLDAVRQGRRIPHGRTAIQGGRVHPRLDQPQPAADREPRCRAPADGAGRLWPGRQCDRDRACDPPGGRRQSADLEIFQHARRGQDGAGGIPRQRLRRLPGTRRQLGTAS